MPDLNNQPQPGVVFWQAPGAVKINTDGSSKENPGKAGMSGVLRDLNDFLVFWVLQLFVVAELKAIRAGLSLAWDLGTSI